jgi:hypothetical protein|tara:strand:+ start:110 stop:412 length:303 start_codon:yes stop_codon:yes gene_type:complete
MYARALAHTLSRQARPRRGPRRGLSAPGGGAAQQRNNVLLAGALFAFTGGVYYTAMGKMRATDELGELEALENKVNVHESGLKITRPRSVHDALQPRKED